MFPDNNVKTCEESWEFPNADNMIFLVYKPLQETKFSLVSNFSIYKEETFKRNESSGFIKFHSSSLRTIICVLYLFLKNKKYYGNGNLLQTFN